mmetsp:Transcript_44969/g.138766  ORF Transcript_44969/g.138766 Transcript_44969/m.138766 type:complete len:224 (-) Transcript_44969:750-1421(-)
MRPQPMRRQWFSKRREMATDVCGFAHTGDMRRTRTMEPAIAETTPPVVSEPTLIWSASPSESFTIFTAFWLALFTPTSCAKREYSISISAKTSGSVPGLPMRLPTSLFWRVSAGSMFVPTPISPPGMAYSSEIFSLLSVFARLRIGRHSSTVSPFAFVVRIRRPGRTSISAPSFSTPSSTDPPATPPASFATSSPGLFTSNERTTIMRSGRSNRRRGTGTWQM